MKSLWNPRDRHEIHDRVRRLSPDATRRWGSLTPHAAVVHLSDSLRMALGEITEAPKSGLLRRQPFKWLAIYMLPMPKDVKGPAGYFTTVPTSYAADRAEFERLIDLCAHRPADAPWGDNPFFGQLSKGQWGCLAYKHIDHHLRQFGA